MIPTYESLVTDARDSAQRLVRVERDGSRAVVRMHEPDRLNVLSAVLTVQLHDELRELVADFDVRTIVLTGSDPAFSAGGDLRLMTDFAHPMADDGEEGAADLWRWIRGQFGGVARVIANSDKPFIAAVNGPAAGVGLAFALSCDLLLLSDRARIVPAFGRIGLLPEVGTSWALTRRLGYQRTFELFAGGRILDAQEAHELGIGNAVVAHDALAGAVEDWCEQLEALPAHVLAMMKPLLRRAADATWEQSIAMEEFAEPICFTTRAHRDGVAAALAKAS